MVSIYSTFKEPARIYESIDENIDQRQRTIKIGEVIFNMELADTDAERIKGLSGRQSLPQDTALVFQFEKEERQGFWMKDMYFPIDMVWVDQNKKIVHIESEVSPNTFPKVFNPEEKALYVIELNSGEVLQNKIKIGDFINF